MVSGARAELVKPNRVTLVPGRHNYRVILERKIAAGEISAPAGGVGDLTIRHDDWCSVYRGGLCDCRPEIELGRP